MLASRLAAGENALENLSVSSTLLQVSLCHSLRAIVKGHKWRQEYGGTRQQNKHCKQVRSGLGEGQ